MSCPPLLSKRSDLNAQVPVVPAFWRLAVGRYSVTETSAVDAPVLSMERLGLEGWR
jgi:hypothetical protein